MTARPGLSKAGDTDVHPSTPQVSGDEPSLLRKGSNTSDSVGSPDRDKLVELTVHVPKSLRKVVRAEAKRRGISMDDLVAEALRDRPGR